MENKRVKNKRKSRLKLEQMEFVSVSSFVRNGKSLEGTMLLSGEEIMDLGEARSRNGNPAYPFFSQMDFVAGNGVVFAKIDGKDMLYITSPSMNPMSYEDMRERKGTPFLQASRLSDSAVSKLVRASREPAGGVTAIDMSKLNSDQREPLTDFYFGRACEGRLDGEKLRLVEALIGKRHTERIAGSWSNDYVILRTPSSIYDALGGPGAIIPRIEHTGHHDLALKLSGMTRDPLDLGRISGAYLVARHVE